MNLFLPVRQLRVGKSGFRGGINRDAVASFSPTLPLRLRWEPNEIGSVNRSAVAPVLNAVCFIPTGHNPFRVGEIVASWSQGSRNGNLGLKDETALRLYPQISITYFQLAHCSFANILRLSR